MKSALLGNMPWEEIKRGAQAYREALKAHEKELRRMVREDKKRIKANT
jgi:hypothetical protein